MVSRDSWVKLSNNKKWDLEHIHFGLSLNKTVDLKIGRLQALLKVIDTNMPMKINTILNHVKTRLNNHFNIVEVYKGDKLIKVL